MPSCGDCRWCKKGEEHVCPFYVGACIDFGSSGSGITFPSHPESVASSSSSSEDEDESDESSLLDSLSTSEDGDKGNDGDGDGDKGNDNDGDDDSNKKPCTHEGCNNPCKWGYQVCAKHGREGNNDIPLKSLCRHPDGCTNQSQKNSLCWKHGGRTDRPILLCSHDVCTSRSIGKQGICQKHGAKVKVLICTVDGCNRPRKRKIDKKCNRHSKVCNHPTCTEYPHHRGRSGFCKEHKPPPPQKKYKQIFKPNIQCKVPGCTTPSKNCIEQLCQFHGGTVPLCKVGGCQNVVSSKGLCVRHGAPVKQCKFDGCQSRPIQGGEERKREKILNCYCSTCMYLLHPYTSAMYISYYIIICIFSSPGYG